jgi:hypothetical protein
MTCFAIPGDMALNADESDAVFVEGLTAVLNQIRAGAQVFKGTWHFDRNAGIDYEQVFVKNPDLRVVRILFWDFLRNVPGVTDVESLDLRVDTLSRTLYVTFSVRTDFGTLQETLALVFPEST